MKAGLLRLVGGSLLLVMLSILPACVHTKTEDGARSTGARLTPGEAIRVAKETARKQGRDLSEYREPEAHYELTTGYEIWTVFFQGKVLAPGNFFTVNVDDKTGDTELLPGK